MIKIQGENPMFLVQLNKQIKRIRHEILMLHDKESGSVELENAARLAVRLEVCFCKYIDQAGI